MEVLLNNTETKQRLEFQDIREIYTKGCKFKSDLKIGLEYERLPVWQATGTAADYYSEFGVCNFLRAFAKAENWDYITDDYNIIGLKQGHDTITLEPGSQIELSLEPKKNIEDIEMRINYLDKVMAPMLKRMGISLLNYGVSPVSTHKSIKLIPKSRYEVMAKYLWGILSDVMMRETAGVQATLDFVDEEDAIRKFKLANKLTPFVTAMFANSPIRGGVDTGYKSFRALSWLNTDNDRCGFCYKLQDDYSFDEYIDYVMDTPVIFINRDGAPIRVNGKINFKEFMLSGYDGFEPEFEDYLLQANLCFPEVRLRNFIEVRNHDCGGKKSALAILALYKGLLQNSTALEELEELFKNAKYNDFSELRYNVPKLALSSRFGKYSVKDFAQEILYISEKSLIEQNTGEENYLEYIKEYTMNGLSPADIIIKNWYGLWHKDVRKLLSYIS